jgi:HEAT repeat protein/beta-lactamase regulating signal transducer with metallopeptidase domain
MTLVDVDGAFVAILSWLLTYAIHSSIFFAAAAVVAWRYAEQHAWLDVIWKAALIAPLLTATLQFDRVAIPLGGRWTMPGAAATIDNPAPTVTTVHRAIERRQPSTDGTSAPAVDRGPVSEQSPPSPEAAAAAPIAPSWPALLAGAWAVIAIVAITRYGIRLGRVYRHFGSGAPVTAADLLDAIDGLRSGANARQSIRLTTNGHCPVPLVLAGGHIVLPERFFDDLEPDQQRAALAHEIAHAFRGDPYWLIAADVIGRAMFFQPLNRMARARWCDSAEFLCDEWAVRQTGSPLALARCLSVVASWWSPDDRLPAGASAMARSDSAMIRRVARILNEPDQLARPRVWWLAIPVMLVAIGAPRVTAWQPEAAIGAALSVTIDEAAVSDRAAQRPVERDWTAPEIAAARAQLRIHRPSRPAAAFDERWRDALAEAGRQRLTDFWIVYTFHTPTHADDLVMSDSREGSIISSGGRLSIQGPPLTDLISPSAVPLEGGNLAVLLHHRGPRMDAIDRAGYRSVQLGFDFGRTPVFWIGDAPEAQSFEQVRTLFGQARDQRIQTFLIELASMHSNTDMVAPFLASLMERSWPPSIREEAAEGFGHHHDPRSVEILLRAARTDPDSSVRAEAAETIGEVQTPQSIPALTDLVAQSTDADVRSEAAEGFGEQPADRAIPAIEHVLATSTHDEVLSEAVEALSEFGAAALPVLVQTANAHPHATARREAVETLGDLGDAAAIDALTRLAWEHQDVAVQREAVETLGDRDEAAATTALERVAREHSREEVQIEAIETLADRSEGSLHALILELAASGRTARIRREALDSIGSAVETIADASSLDRVQQAIERAIFDDPDRSVQLEALDALDELPGDRAPRVLRDVIARHPDARLRREAEEQLRERRQ